MILPGAVAARLSRQYAPEKRLDGNATEESAEGHLELTVIGETAVLTASPAYELELQAALAYAIVKGRRRQLLEKLAKSDEESFVQRGKRFPFLRFAANESAEP